MSISCKLRHAVIAGCLLVAASRHVLAQSRPPLAAADIADIVTLERIEDRREFDIVALRRIAASKHPELRRRAALAIARLYDFRGRALLGAMHAEQDTAVLATIVWSTGQLVDTSAVVWLDSLLQNPATPIGVAVEAAGAFGKIRTTDTRYRLLTYLRAAAPTAATAPVVGEALLSIGRHRERGGISTIAQWATNPDLGIRWRATWALFRPRDPAATRALLSLADDPSPDVRYWAVRSLTGPRADSSDVGSAAAQRTLMVALGDEDRRVRTEAVRALGTYNDTQSFIQLALLLDDPDMWVAVNAAEALGARGDKVKAALTPLTAATSVGHTPWLRSAALGALTSVWLASALEPAIAMSTDTSLTVRISAATALGKLGVGARPALIKLRTDLNREVRTIANTAWLSLADTNDNRAVRRAARRTAFASVDPALRTAAAMSMLAWADSTDVPMLLNAFVIAVKDASPAAAEATIATIGAIDRRGGGATAAFFKRFPSSPSDVIWGIAGRELGDRTVAAWGPGRPVHTARTDADYRRIVETLVVPAYNGVPHPRVRWETTRGTIETELNPLDAPLATDYLLSLVALNKINGVRFERVVPNFVDQQKEVLPEQTLQRDEISRGRIIRGRLSWGSQIGHAANFPNLRGPGAAYDTGPAVYTIALIPGPHNEGDFTWLGHVTSGMEVADKVQLGDVERRVTRVKVVAGSASAQVKATDQVSGTKQLLIAVSPVNDRVAWASGTRGTWVRTTDGGTTWLTGQVLGADSLQFRDVHAESAESAWLLSIGDSLHSRIFHTTDGGAHWMQQFVVSDPKDFLDCFSFWDAKHAIAIGDSNDGRLMLLRTEDGGDHWTRVPSAALPAAGAGEGSFAASGLCAETQAGGNGWTVMSNLDHARVLRTPDYGHSWSVDTLPLTTRAGGGPTSVTFLDERHGMVLGGAGDKPESSDVLVAVTTDGGKHWTPRGKPAILRGVSGGVYVPGTKVPTVVAVGYAGAAYTTDDGATWTTIDGNNYWSVGFASPKAGWAVGRNGRITKLSGF